jgi:hypothetical protein
VPGHDSQARSGVDSPLTWTPAGVSALNAPAGGAGLGAAARDPLERGKLARGGVWLSIETGPRARGTSSPRARQICTEAAPYPSSGAEFRLRVAGPIV